MNFTNPLAPSTNARWHNHFHKQNFALLYQFTQLTVQHKSTGAKAAQRMMVKLTPDLQRFLSSSPTMWTKQLLLRSDNQKLCQQKHSSKSYNKRVEVFLTKLCETHRKCLHCRFRRRLGCSNCYSWPERGWPSISSWCHEIWNLTITFRVIPRVFFRPHSRSRPRRSFKMF